MFQPENTGVNCAGCLIKLEWSQPLKQFLMCLPQFRELLVKWSLHIVCSSNCYSGNCFIPWVSISAYGQAKPTTFCFFAIPCEFIHLLLHIDDIQHLHHPLLKRLGNWCESRAIGPRGLWGPSGPWPPMRLCGPPVGSPGTWSFCHHHFLIILIIIIWEFSTTYVRLSTTSNTSLSSSAAAPWMHLFLQYYWDLLSLFVFISAFV